MKHIYILVLFGYGLIVMLATLIWRQKQNEEEFWTEGRRIAGLRAGISLSATFMSVSWCIVYGIDVFLKYGKMGFFVLGFPWLLVLLCFLVLAPRLRAIPVFSQPELIRRHFGDGAGFLGALPIFAVFVIWGGAELDVAASILAKSTGFEQTHLVWGLCVCIALYMSLNGTRAVITTDVIQYVLVGMFFIILVFLGWNRGTVQQDLPTRSVEELHPLFVVLTLLAYVPGWLSETDIWIRLQATKDGRQARIAMAVTLVNSVLFMVIFPFIVAALLPSNLTSGLSGVNYLLDLIRIPLLAGCAALGLIAASMSTIDTCSNVAAMTLSFDCSVKRTRGKNVGAIWVVGLLMACYALYSDSLRDAFYLSSALLSTSIFLPVCACYLKISTPRVIKTVLVLGPVLTILFYIIEKKGWWALPHASGLSYILCSFVSVLFIFLLGETPFIKNRFTNSHCPSPPG